jgi:hypothetical protein
MSAINVNSITGRTGTHGPVLTGITTATNGIHVTGGSVGIGTDNPGASLQITANNPGILFQDANSGATESKIEGSSGHLFYTTDNLNRDHIFSATGESEALRITGDGNVGIGTDNPIMRLHVHGAANSADSRIRLSSIEGSGLTIRAQSATENNINADSGEDITFSRGNDETLRLTSTGNVGIRTDNPGRNFDVEGNAQIINNGGTAFITGRDRALETYGAIGFADADTVQITAGSGGTRNVAMQFRTANSGTETNRMTINSAGDVFFEENIYVDEIWSRTTDNGSTLILGCRNAVGTESETCRAQVSAGLLVGRTSSAFNNAGHTLWTGQGGADANGAVYHERDAASTTVMWVHHMQSSTTGTFINFTRGNSDIGSITFSGTTVSYNPFLGSHWASLTDRSKPNLLPGTILETVNQLMEWKLAVFTVDGETKKMAWNGTESVGSTVTVTYEGSDYTATIQLEEDAEELNKHVCVKVNDTVGSSAVFGVFLGWDDTNNEGTDEVNPIIGAWNDMNVAAVGNYFIRIASGQTVAIGDLIEADGSGCGVVQNDDIIRSKTVAKVTSTTAQETYDDGSFLVTCVLCCG